MDTQEESGPFPHSTINMDSIWDPPSTQNSMGDLPAIRVSDSIPEITFSGPEESHFIAPDHIPIATQSQVNVHYPHAGDESFNSFLPANSTFTNEFSGGIDIAPQMSMAWNNSDPFVVPAAANTSTFPEFDFNSDPSLSFTQMMNLDNTRPPKVTINSHIDAFNNADMQLTEPIPTPITPADADSNVEDPTHADVHALLHEHYTTTLQMLSMCMQSCEHATADNDMVKNVVMKNLRLLKTGIQASSVYYSGVVGHVLTLW